MRSPPPVITALPDTGEKNDNAGTDADWAMVNWTRIATVIAGGLLLLGWWDLRSQRIDSAEQQKLGREMLILANPPKVIVRDIRSPLAQELATFMVGKNLKKVDDALEVATAIALRSIKNPLEERTAITATFLVINKGKTRAIIKNSDCHFIVSAGTPPENPCDNNARVLPLVTLAPGEARQVEAPSIPISGASDKNPMMELGFMKAELYLIGLIIYTDELGNARRTGFRRVFNADSASFEGSPHPDWEFVD